MVQRGSLCAFRACRAWTKRRPKDSKGSLTPSRPARSEADTICRQLELQARAFARKHGMRVACIRPHWVIPESLAYDPEKLAETGGLANDLWAWTSEGQAARAFLLGLTAPETTFPDGTAEAFFVVAPTTVRREPTKNLIKEHFPEVDVKNWKCDFNGNEGLYDCSKAERMLGWTERAFPWSPAE